MDDLRGARLRISVEASLDCLKQLRHFVEESAIVHHAEAAAISDLQLAVDEAATNIILHGYHGKEGQIEVEMERNDNTLVVRIRDNAPAFDPANAPPPDLDTDPMEHLQAGGYGVYLMIQFVDVTQYHRTQDNRNELVLIKKHAVRC